MTPDKPYSPSAGRTGAKHQFICSECGDPFSSEMSTAKTCGSRCRKRRSTRFGRGDRRDYAVDTSPVLEAMEKATSQALDDLPSVAREVLAEELRPAMREGLTGDVLTSIKDMMGLVPLAQQALADELTAVKQVFNEDGSPQYDPDGNAVVVSDSDTRLKAVALLMKYTVGQPGLAPQPEQPDAAPLVINFGGMPALQQPTTAHEGDEPVEIAAGERMCDLCAAVKPDAEFVGSSSRCLVCHEGNRDRVRLAIEERTKGRE